MIGVKQYFEKKRWLRQTEKKNWRRKNDGNTNLTDEQQKQKCKNDGTTTN